MRLVEPDSRQSLNDDGSEKHDIQTIKENLTSFRHDKNIVKRALQDRSYQRMINQIDKHWEKLFADPITIQTTDGPKTIYPQRTNNIIERFFRDLKRPFRQKSGTSSLCKTFKAILTQTPLVKNLQNEQYLQLLLKEKNSLEQRFAEIDASLVRTYLLKQGTLTERVPRKLKKLLKLSDLPQRLLQKSNFRLDA